MSIRDFITKYTWRVGAFIAFIAVIVTLRLLDVGSWLNMETLQRYEELLIAYVRDYYWQSVLTFILIYTVESALALPFSFILTIAAGFLYGIFPAVMYSVIGATSGATLAFLISRYLIGHAIQRYYHNALTRFNREVKENGAYYLIMLRLIPIVPFFLINVLSGVTHISLFTFVVTTAIGMIPGTVVYAAAGYRLRTIEKIGDIVTWETIAILIVLVLFAIAPVIVKKWLRWKPLQKGK